MPRNAISQVGLCIRANLRDVKVLNTIIAHNKNLKIPYDCTAPMKPNKLQFSKKIKLTPDLLILYEISQVNSIPTSIHFGVIFRRPGGNRQLVANIIILQAWSFAWWRDWHNWNPSWMQLSSHFGTNAFECSEFYFFFYLNRQPRW